MRLPPVADERSATREKTRSIATKRERDDYVFEWTGVPTVQLRSKLTKSLAFQERWHR